MQRKYQQKEHFTISQARIILFYSRICERFLFQTFLIMKLSINAICTKTSAPNKQHLLLQYTRICFLGCTINFRHFNRIFMIKSFQYCLNRPIRIRILETKTKTKNYSNQQCLYCKFLIIY